MSSTAYMARPRGWRRTLFLLGLTAIFVAYFLVWLPGPGVGLQLIGIEIGEWIKFLGVGARRNLLYLPPIVLGLCLALWAATWPNSRPQTWLARVLAVGIAMLAFPAVAAIQLEPPSEWAWRLGMIALVALVAFGGPLFAQKAAPAWLWLLMAVVAVVGAILPSWAYLSVLPVAREIMHRPVGIGLGVWLNAAGALLVAAVALAEWSDARRAAQKSTAAPEAAALK